VKKCVFNVLGLGWFRMKKHNSSFSEFCNVGARPELGGRATFLDKSEVASWRAD
jgi:hypothetical protein